jgi:hypothetical protein
VCAGILIVLQMRPIAYQYGDGVLLDFHLPPQLRSSCSDSARRAVRELMNSISRQRGTIRKHLLRLRGHNEEFMFQLIASGAALRINQGKITFEGDFADITKVEGMCTGSMNGEVFELPTPHSIAFAPSSSVLTLRVPRTVTMIGETQVETNAGEIPHVRKRPRRARMGETY